MTKPLCWALGLAAAGVAALGVLSCSSGDVSGIFVGSGVYDVVYEFDNRSGTCIDSRPTLPDGSANPNFGLPCPAPGPSTLRLELEGFRDATTPLFALRAYDFSTLSTIIGVNFTLQFNTQLLMYLYPRATEKPRAPDYSGARPSGPWDGPDEGLANTACNGCCIEWTDLSCRYPSCKWNYDSLIADVPERPSVSLCIKRSCTPSGGPGPSPDYACEVVCCATSGCPDRLNPTNRCRAENLTAAEHATCPDGCHNSCNEPLLTDSPNLLCCFSDLDKQKQDGPCLSGVAMSGAVAYLPLKIQSARSWSDFQFLFDAAEVRLLSGATVGACCQTGQSDVTAGLMCDTSPSPCATWRTGKGTIVVPQ